MPKKLGEGSLAAQSGKRRARSGDRDAGHSIVETLERRIVLTTLQLAVDLTVADSVPSADVVAQALEDGRVLQQTSREDRLIFLDGADVRFVDVHVVNAESRTDGDSDADVQLSYTYDSLSAAQVVQPAILDSSSNVEFDSGAVSAEEPTSVEVVLAEAYSNYLVIADVQPDAVGSVPVTSDQSFVAFTSEEPPSADVLASENGEYKAGIEEPYLHSVEPPRFHYDFTIADDIQSSPTQTPFVGPVPWSKVMPPLEEPGPQEVDQVDDVKVILTLDEQLAGSLSSEVLRDLVASVQTLVVGRAPAAAEGGSFRWVFRTTLPRHRASTSRSVVTAPVARLQQVVNTGVALPPAGTSNTSAQRQQAPPEAQSDRLPARKARRPKVATPARTQDGYVKHAKLRSNDAAAIDVTTSRTSSSHSSDNSPVLTNDAAVSDSEFPVVPTEKHEVEDVSAGASALVVEDPLGKIREGARPEYAVQIGSSGDDERSGSQVFDARLVRVRLDEASPVEIERPSVPVVESQVLRQLEFETAPRGPPISEAVAPGSVSDRASELRLRMLRHSQAPRSPSMVLAN
ncbi:MAG: hypothetical protein AB8G99_21725 [Planctomycetaceae bacterium]